MKRTSCVLRGAERVLLVRPELQEVELRDRRVRPVLRVLLAQAQQDRREPRAQPVPAPWAQRALPDKQAVAEILGTPEAPEERVRPDKPDQLEAPEIPETLDRRGRQEILETRALPGKPASQGLRVL